MKLRRKIKDELKKDINFPKIEESAKEEFQRLWISLKYITWWIVLVFPKDKVYSIENKDSNWKVSTYKSNDIKVLSDPNNPKSPLVDGEMVLSLKSINLKNWLFNVINPDWTLDEMKITEIKNEQAKTQVESLTWNFDDISVKLFEKLRTSWESIAFSPTSLKQSIYLYTLFSWRNDIAQRLWFVWDEAEKVKSLINSMNLPESSFKTFNWVFQSKWGEPTEDQKTLMNNIGVELWKIDKSNITLETQRLNKLVSEKTHWMITNMFTEKYIASAQDIFLNTVYFKWEWSEPMNTWKRMEFWNWKADFMNRKSLWEYWATNSSEIVSMPFKDGSKMIAFLPKNDLKSTITEANKLLKDNSLGGNKSILKNYIIDLTFPKFNVESTLNNIWKELWVWSDLDIMQKAKVEVDEKWAEASAATSVTSKGLIISKGAKDIKFNKPFYYVIQDLDWNTQFMWTYEWEKNN